MEEFKNWKEQYQQEVQPQYEEKHWESFDKYRNSKKRDRGLIIFFFGLALCSALIWIIWPKHNAIIESEVAAMQNKEIPSLSGEKLQTTTNVITTSADDATMNTEPEASEQLTVHESDESYDSDAKGIDKQNNSQSFKGTITEINSNAAQEKSTQLPFLNSSDQSASITADEVLSSETEVKRNAVIDTNLENQSERIADNHQRKPIAYSAPISGSIQKMISYEKAISPFALYIKPAPKTIARKGTLEGKVFTGISYPSHTLTFEEQAFQFGISVNYYLTERVRLKSELEFGNVDFETNVMDPIIGIALVDSPDGEADFVKASYESMALKAGLGLDLILIKNRPFEPYVGAAYNLIAEIVKDVDYEFNGKEINSTDDDFVVSIINDDRYFIPHVIKFEAGFKYEFPIAGLNFSASYPLQLNKEKLELLRQWQFNIGISKKF